MNPLFHKIALICSTAILLNACSYNESKPHPIALESSSGSNCSSMPTVIYQQNDDDAVVTIMAGDKPTPGYGIDIIRSTLEKTNIEILFSIVGPPPGRMLPQMMTKPCLEIALPNDNWQTISVTSADSGQAWHFAR